MSGFKAKQVAVLLHCLVFGFVAIVKDMVRFAAFATVFHSMVKSFNSC